MNRINQSLAGTLVDPAGGNGSPPGPTSENFLTAQQITSSPWEGWWWAAPEEGSATDPEAP